MRCQVVEINSSQEEDGDFRRAVMNDFGDPALRGLLSEARGMWACGWKWAGKASNAGKVGGVVLCAGVICCTVL